MTPDDAPGQDQQQVRTTTRRKIVDARGRRVSQLDPVAMHLLRQQDVIPAEELRAIATAVDPKEVRVRPRAALMTPAWITLWYAAFFGYFYITKRWRGWDPVLVAFATFYFLYPIALLFFGAYRARRRRWQRIKDIMIEHHYCPHCGYDLRGGSVVAVAADDPNEDRERSDVSSDVRVTVCSECGCAWAVPPSEAESGQDDEPRA